VPFNFTPFIIIMLNFLSREKEREYK